MSSQNVFKIEMPCRWVFQTPRQRVWSASQILLMSWLNLAPIPFHPDLTTILYIYKSYVTILLK